jgi:hypothetical protein
MTAQKRILASIIGALVLFILGWVMYGMLFAGFFENNAGTASGVMKSNEEMSMLWLFVGNLFQAYLLVYIFGKWANISTFMGGLTNGIILALIMAYGYNMIGYATSNVSNLTAALVDPLIMAVMYGLAGGAIGWVLGYKKA